MNNKLSQNFNQDKKNTFSHTTTPTIKSPAKPPIQLIEKPKNIINNKNNQTNKTVYNSGDKRQLLNKSDQNKTRPKTKNLDNRKNTPELVGAPIRKDQTKLNFKESNISLNRILISQGYRITY